MASLLIILPSSVFTLNLAKVKKNHYFWSMCIGCVHARVCVCVCVCVYFLQGSTENFIFFCWEFLALLHGVCTQEVLVSKAAYLLKNNISL